MAGRFRWNDAEARRVLDSDDGPVGRRLRAAAARVEAEAKRRCPVDTGRLRESIGVQMGRDERGRYADVGTDVPYALPVELGSRPHVIRSHGDYPLRNRDAGQVFGQQVNHPGTKPRPYLRPALDVLRRDT